MKKKVLCGVLSVLMFLSMFFLNFNSCEALETADSMITGAESWTIKDQGPVNTAKSIMATLINVIRVVGTGVALIMITYVAIKYMSAAPEEKAEFKKSAVGFIVGAVVLFAGSNILTIIAKFATANTQ